MTRQSVLLASFFVFVACTPKEQQKEQPNAQASAALSAGSAPVATAASALPTALPSASAAAGDAKCTAIPWKDNENVGDATYEGKLGVDAEATDANGKKENPYILTLDKPACGRASTKDTKEIHVYASDDKVKAQLKSLLGKRVKVTGDGFTPHTAHHHRPIVVAVKTISGAGE